MMQKLISLLLISFFGLFFYCAHQVAPGGGPDDTEKPEILWSIPKSESAKVNTDSKITIAFSEWIDPKSDRSVSIFPPVKLKVKVARNRLEIEPLHKLQDSSTYHIVINTSLKDLHNNPISSPYNLVFSTGEKLDSGSISGCVIDPSKEFLQPKIALFKEKTVSDSGFTGQPDFLFQTDSTGFFDINYIGTGDYKIIAFLDNNHDSKLQGESEPIYLPEDSLIKISNNKVNIEFYPASFDTTLPRIVSVQPASNRLIFGNWNRAFDSLSGFVISPFTLSCSDSSQKPEILRYLHFKNSTKFAIKLKNPLTTSQYRLSYVIEKTYDTSSVSDTVLFNGIITEDTTKPVLKSWSPQGISSLTPEIKIIWSEPVQFCDSILMTDTLSDSVWAFSNKEFSDTTTLTPSRKLRVSNNYSIHILDNFAIDLSGNNLLPRDSTDTVQVLTVRCIDADSIAVSLQGGAPCFAHHNNLKWLFTLFNSSFSAVSENNNGFFRFDSIPSGKGLISYFIDNNQNGIYDKGRLIPWCSPEPYFTFSDTIEARARWDIEGISFPDPCDPCKKKLPDLEESLPKH
jgi:hypothetical protein